MKKKLIFTIIQKEDQSTLFTWCSTVGIEALRRGWDVLVVVPKECSVQWVPKGIQLLRAPILHESCIEKWIVKEDYTLYEFVPCHKTSLGEAPSTLIYTVCGRTKDFFACTRMLLHSFRAFHPDTWYDLAVLSDLDCRDLCKEYKAHYIQLPPLKSIYEASAAKLSLYTYFNTDSYTRILYLDSDILLRGDIKDALLEIKEDGIFHVVQEGYLQHSNYCGTTEKPFQNLKISKMDPGFSAGVIAWWNGPRSRTLLEEIESISEEGEGCLEQPWLNRVLWEQKCASTSLLQGLVTNRPEKLSNTICHFNGSIGDGKTKTERMLAFLATCNQTNV
jgi:hypothetical protein